MKAHKNWSYAPYSPLFWNSGDIYICRLAPGKNHITLQWLDAGAACYEVYVRVRGEGEFVLAGSVTGTEYTISTPRTDTDYELFVQAGEKKSRIRLARCAEPVGVVVNYLHPEDEAYAFSGRYLCSPSLLRHPDGYLLASMDLFEGTSPQNLTLIFRSDDDGKTWHYVRELMPCFWGRMFLYQGDVYMLGCSTEYGDLLIGKSSDGGRTFTEPAVLLRGCNGKNDEVGVHKNPQPVVEFGGRIWNTLEWGSWGRGYHAPMVMSAPMGSDLLDADNWSFSEPVKYDPTWPGVPEGPSTGNIEGCLVVLDGKLHNVMRFDMSRMHPNYGQVVDYEVNTEDPEAPLQYSRCIPFPGNHAKFMIKQNPVNHKFYSIVSYILDEAHSRARNYLCLLVSDNGVNWRLDRPLQDRRSEPMQDVGFQYVDFFFEGERLLYLCRTALNGAHNYHDANYSTFHSLML